MHQGIYLERDLQALRAAENLADIRGLMRAACLRTGGLIVLLQRYPKPDAGQPRTSGRRSGVSERLAGRAQSNISRSLQLLARYRLIQLTREGREVRAEPVAKALRVDLATGTYETEAAA